MQTAYMFFVMDVQIIILFFYSFWLAVSNCLCWSTQFMGLIPGILKKMHIMLNTMHIIYNMGEKLDIQS